MSIVIKDDMVCSIYEAIKSKNLKVVLPEGEDDRVCDAVGLAPGITKVLLGNKANIEKKLADRKYSQEVLAEVVIIDYSEYSQREDLIQLFLDKRKGKLTEENARKLINESNYFATLLLENGDVDSLVGGCVYSTADILKPAFQIIKPAPGNSVVSSCFILQKGEEKLVFGDCAVNIDPTKIQLKEITRQTIATAIEMGIDPKVAMLSYSTKGSGTGAYVDLVKAAYDELVEETPEFKDILDGELQFDAAYVPRVGDLKAPGSPVAGQANVFIFPHINSGNIGYKMVQYLGGYDAVGPILQGLNKPVNDLSRGTDAETIAKLSYLSLRSYK